MASEAWTAMKAKGLSVFERFDGGAFGPASSL